jgi:hypothetical protein
MTKDVNYDQIKDLIESHTNSISERMDRFEARTDKRFDGIDQQLSELCVDGCAKGIVHGQRLDKIEGAPARVGAVIIGIATVVSIIVSVVSAFVLHLRRGG